jgi:hypothetical protein
LWVMNRREFNSVLDASATIARQLLVTLAGRLRNAQADRPAQYPFAEPQGRVDLHHTGWQPGRAPIDDRRRGELSGRGAALR